MRISSVKSFSWLAVNRHHLLSNGAAIITQRQARQYLIHNRGDSSAIMNVILPSLSVKLRLFLVVIAAPSESRRWRFTANQETDFTDEMHIIEFD